MINEVQKWLAENQELIESRCLSISVVGPTEQQTKKAIAIHISSSEQEGTFICWETGECDIDIADLAADRNLPISECVISSHYEFNSPNEVDQALQKFFKQLI